jgi:hypothetical protein
MNYSERHLSYASDRLPALSGIASEFEKVLEDDTYFHGLWFRDANHGLLWTQKRPLPAIFTGTVAPNWPQAPSWSWASLDAPVHWPNQLGKEHRWLRNSTNLVQIARPDDSTPNTLVLTGRLMRFQYPDAVPSWNHGPAHDWRFSIREDTSYDILFGLDQWYANHFHRDHRSDKDPRELACLDEIFFMPSIYSEASGMGSYHGLLLLQHNDPAQGTFRRVGTAQMSSDTLKHQDNIITDGWFFQKNIQEDHYLKRDKTGIYTVAVV